MNLPALYDRNYRFSHARSDSKPALVGRLTPRDRLIVRTAFDFRALSTSLLHQAVSREFPTSKSAFWRVLRRLWRSGYLDRIPEVYLRVIGVESNVLWAIGPNGYELLAPELGLPVERARRVTAWNVSLAPWFLRHRLDTNAFVIGLLCALHRHEQVRVQLQPPELLEIGEAVVIPDARLDLVHEDGIARFMVEVDEATTPVARWLRSKAWGYSEYWRAHPTEPFVVLTIAPTPGRRDRLRTAVARFLNEAAAKGTTYPAELWAFTDRTLYDDEPASILADIWYGVRGMQRRSLLDL
jgi:hypothetical protein